MGDAGRGPREEPGARDERITPGQLRPGRAPRSAAQSGARRWLAALAAVAVVAGGVALAGELTSGNGPATAALPSPLSGLPVRPAADPPAFAGVLQSRTSARQWIKLFSPVTGRVVRSVAAGGGGNGFALSPDSRVVYVVGPVKGQIRIERISVATGHGSFVADGAQPAVSPDGRYLAYATGRLFTRLAIRDLRTGVTRVVNLASLIGSASGLLNGQVTWLGSSAQIVAMPMPFGTAVAARTPSARAAARNSCGRQSQPGRTCVIVVDLSGGHPVARRVRLPGSWSGGLISGDVASGHTLLVTRSLVSQPEIGAATISAAGVTVRDVAALPRDALPEAFAPGGDRILYVRGHGRPTLWVATISGGRLSGARRLFTDDSKVGFGGAAW